MSYHPIPTQDDLETSQQETVRFFSKKESRSWRRSKRYGSSSFMGSHRTSLVEFENNDLQRGVRKMQAIVRGKEWKYGKARIVMYFW
jgi:hypothetical protein